jgi:hypothetical protein
MTMTDVILIIAGLVGAVFAIDFLRGRHTSKEVEKFNAQRQEALQMDKQIDKLKTEVIRDTLSYEEKLAKHRARFGSSSKPGSGDSNRQL